MSLRGLYANRVETNTEGKLSLIWPVASRPIGLERIPVARADLRRHAVLTETLRAFGNDLMPLRSSSMRPRP
ncbi:hypothetical protein X759_33095 [Mesorhizobium sp. LSHC420B00]|nr:hypothetical protein X759_33095 [Mesorhizobium sp. LSHC420B00]